mgnify:FL=1
MAQTRNFPSIAPLRAWGFVLLTPLLGASLGSLGSAALTSDLASPTPRWMTSQDPAPLWPVSEHDVSNSAANS